MPTTSSPNVGVVRRARLNVPGLYAITDSVLCAAPVFETAVRSALRGGARMVQYRDKSEDAALRADQARLLTQLCAEFGALAIINDDVALAKAVGADGVHLGRDDMAVSTARDVLGDDVLVGVSSYNQMPPADSLAGVDYVAFGSFFSSPTKPGAVRAAPDLLREARTALPLPITAIGGITPDNGGTLVAAGAHHLAVITAVFGASDIEAAAEQFAKLFRD